jgi:type IV secretion system protein VirD4
MFFRKHTHQPPPSDMGDPNGVYLGRFWCDGNVGKPLVYGQDRHLLLLGPTGSGKGTRFLVGNLLHSRGRSLIATDMKGELAAMTAGYRRALGDVVILNPFNLHGLGSDGFNPLMSLDPDSDTFVDDAVGIGEALIKIEGKDPHWSESAQGLVVGTIMWEVVCAKREGRMPLLENVRRILTEPDEYEMFGGKSRLVRGLRVTVRRMCVEGGFEIESLVGKFLRGNDEMAGIQSTADRQTTWMLSRPMRADLARNGIDFRDLKRRPTTVYLVLPAERMRTHSVWLRLVIVTALRALYSPGGVKTLFLLDEFAQLGHLGPIEDAFGLVRGFGVSLFPVLQDLGQLKALYQERWETFIGNAGAVIGLTPNDLTTAEWMSRRAGDTTIVAASFNQGNSLNTGGQGSSDGMGYQQQRRRLYLPQELMDFPSGTGLIWPAGTSMSVPFFAPEYWNISELRGRAMPNPYHQ